LRVMSRWKSYSKRLTCSCNTGGKDSNSTPRLASCGEGKGGGGAIHNTVFTAHTHIHPSMHNVPMSAIDNMPIACIHLTPCVVALYWIGLACHQQHMLRVRRASTIGLQAPTPRNQANGLDGTHRHPCGGQVFLPGKCGNIASFCTNH
jgi:hypothetical protein